MYGVCSRGGCVGGVACRGIWCCLSVSVGVYVFVWHAVGPGCVRACVSVKHIHRSHLRH